MCVQRREEVGGSVTVGAERSSSFGGGKKPQNINGVPGKAANEKSDLPFWYLAVVGAVTCLVW